MTSRSSAYSSSQHRIDVTNCTYSSTSASMPISHIIHVGNDLEIERLKEENRRLNSVLYDRHSSEEETAERPTRKLNIGKEDDDIKE